MIELYELPGCPYCAKVKRKLDELQLDYQSHTVSPNRSQRTVVQEVSGQTSVPVLIDSDHGISGMAESDEIVAYLDRIYG